MNQGGKEHAFFWRETVEKLLFQKQRDLHSPQSQHIQEMEHVPDDKIVSYVGSGNFAIIEKTEDGKFTILKTIPVENSDRVKSMKAFVEGCKV